MENDFISILKIILPIFLTLPRKAFCGVLYIAYAYLLLGALGFVCLQIMRYQHPIKILLLRIYAICIFTLTSFYLYSITVSLPANLVYEYQNLQIAAINDWLWVMVLPFIFGVGIGFGFWVIFMRYVMLYVERFLNWISRSNYNLEKDSEQTYKERQKKGVKQYDPSKYYKIDKGLIFLGWNAEHHKPIYESYETFKKKHVQSLGRSQAGKNKILQPLTVQMLMNGSLVIMLDVKEGGDDVMPPILYKATQELGLPYNYMEFGMTSPAQFNILDSKDVDTLYEILIQLCNLQKTQDMATDYYQQQARQTIFEIASFIASQENQITIKDIMTTYLTQFFDEDIKPQDKSKVQTTLEVYCNWECINSKHQDTPTIKSIIDNGGVWYIQAKTDVAYVIIQAIIAIIQKTPNKSRHITLVADEFFKYINNNMIQIFTEGGGKGIQCFTAYQTAALLKAPQLGITNDEMVGTLFANCSYSYIYGSNDPFIFSQIEKSSGTVAVNVESSTTTRNIAVIDKQDSEKRYSRQLNAKVTSSMLNQLKDSECYLLHMGRPTYLTHVGSIPLMEGVFDKGKLEFKKLLNVSRKLTYSFDNIPDPVESNCAGNKFMHESSEYNPFG